MDGEPIYDGGLLANFPGKEWQGKYPERPFLGLYLGPQVRESSQERSTIEHVLEIATSRDDYDFIDNHRDAIVVIDPAPISTTAFDLSGEEAEFLVLQGRACALEHMAHVFADPDLRARALGMRGRADSAKSVAEARVNSRRVRRRVRRVGLVLVLLLGAAILVWFGKY
jgi:hypothetical protein